MAVVLDTIATVETRTVYTKPPDYARQYTAIPRAIVNFSLAPTAISLKPVNDQQELQLTLALNREFAYRLLDFNVWVTQDVAADWENFGYMEIVNGVRNLPVGTVMRHSVVLAKTRRIDALIEMWNAGFDHGTKPGYLIQAVNTAATTVVRFEAANIAAAAGAAGSVGAMITFMEYEIEQAEYVAMHHPSLAYVR